MDKKIAVFVGLGIFVVIAGALAAKSSEDEAQEIRTVLRDDVAAEVSADLPYSAHVSAHEYDGDLSISISPSDKSITHMGDKIVDGVRAVDAAFPEEKIDLTILGDEISFMRYSFESIYGVVVDNRSGDSKVIRLAAEEDICNIFPAAFEHLQILKLSPKAAALYQDIYGRLWADASVPEDEIFSAAAVEYGLTPEQLKDYYTKLMTFCLVGGDTEPEWPAAEPSATQAPATPAPAEGYVDAEEIYLRAEPSSEGEI